MYLEIDEGYPGHRKTLRLCALLKCDTADAYPPRLWAWAARSAPDGDLTGMDAVEVELALRWRGADGALFAALVGAGFIDQECVNGPTTIHNWTTRTGGAIEKMADRAYMAKERRAHMDGRCLPACRYCDGTLTIRSQARSNQDKARQVQSSDPDLSPSASLGSVSGPDRPRSEERAEVIGFGPSRDRPRRLDAMDATIPFMNCFRLYPNQNARLEAAQTWQDIASDYPGGGDALSKAILARFEAGMLKRHPYAGLQKYRPTFETFLLGRRWEDADSAPDDVEAAKPAETLAQRDERARREGLERRIAAKADLEAKERAAMAAIAARAAGGAP